MDTAMRRRLAEITTELIRLQAEIEQLTAAANEALRNGKPATSRRNQIRSTVMEVRYRSLTRERDDLATRAA